MTYTNEECRVVEYCSKIAPCVGEPVNTLPNGIIVFDLTNNTMPSNVYSFNNKCYQLTNAGNSYFSAAEQEVLFGPGQIISPQNWIYYLYLKYDF